MKRGVFIVIEGIDGAGSTTQTQLLCDELRRREIKTVQTREPYDAALTKRVRQWLREDNPPHHALMLAFALDRQVHLRECVVPALQRGETVVSDRYTISTMVYQRQHNDAELVRELCGFAPEPDLSILLDLPPSEALARRKRRALPPDVYERDQALQERIAEEYRHQFESRRAVPGDTPFPQYLTLDCGRLSILDTHAEVLHAVEQAGLV